MNFIGLPYFYENYKFNYYFTNLITEHPEKIKINCKIDFFYGAFPWSLWNGGVNSNQNNQVLYYDIIQSFNKIILDKPIVLDCSNIFLQEIDKFNIYQNIILKELNGSSVYLEISDLTLLNYIKEKYKYYKFIISDNINNIIPLENEKILNNFLNNDDILKVILPNNFQFLNQIEHKNKIILPIGQCYNCNNFKECSIIEQKAQVNFSELSKFNSCSIYKFPNYLEEIQYYNNYGINHFKISPIKGNYNLLEFNYNILKSFIKEEYIVDVIEECLKEGLI